jgi:hypothetical protein
MPHAITGRHVSQLCPGAVFVPLAALLSAQQPHTETTCSTCCHAACVCSSQVAICTYLPQVAQMDADVEPVDVDSSADEEEMKQAALDHLDATVISYVLVSVLQKHVFIVYVCDEMCTLSTVTAAMVTAAIIRFVCSMPAQLGAPCIRAGSWNAGPLVHDWYVGSAAVDVRLRLVWRGLAWAAHSHLTHTHVPRTVRCGSGRASQWHACYVLQELLLEPTRMRTPSWPSSSPSAFMWVVKNLVLHALLRVRCQGCMQQQWSPLNQLECTVCNTSSCLWNTSLLS